MCKSKEEFPPFGKVCDVHNNGNKATIEMCSQITGVASEKVNAVFNDLRKEGKGLPEPSQEEVKEYASSQVFIAKYDPKIQDKSRNRIVNWWRKARDTQPSGGLMHAWKNTLPQTLARYRRTTLASVAMFSIALTSACGSTPPQNNNENTSSPIATTAPATPSEEATVKPTETAKPVESTKPSSTLGSKAKQEISNLEKQGIKLGDKVSIDGGSYPSYEITNKSNLGKFDSSKNSGGIPSGWNKKDTEDAQIKASNFFMNTVLNPPTKTDYNSNIKPLEKSLDKDVLPAYRAEFKDNAQSNESTVFTKDIFEPGGNYSGYSLINDGETPRIKNVKINVSESQQWDGGIYYTYKGTYTLSALNTKTKKPKDIDAKIEYGITVTKGDDGKMYINGTQEIEEQYEDVQ